LKGRQGVIEEIDEALLRQDVVFKKEEILNDQIEVK
jgi:hypothetical protein